MAVNHAFVDALTVINNGTSDTDTCVEMDVTDATQHNGSGSGRYTIVVAIQYASVGQRAKVTGGQKQQKTVRGRVGTAVTTHQEQHAPAQRCSTLELQ